MTNGLFIYGEIFFPHLLGSPTLYMSLQLLHSEFPDIWGKFDFLFYQCEERLPNIWGNAQIFHHIRYEEAVSRIDFAPDPSEFPYIYEENFIFCFFSVAGHKRHFLNLWAYVPVAPIYWWKTASWQHQYFGARWLGAPLHWCVILIKAIKILVAHCLFGRLLNVLSALACGKGNRFYTRWRQN